MSRIFWRYYFELISSKVYDSERKETGKKIREIGYTC